MNYIEAEAGVGVLLTRTLRDRDVEKEATGKYSCRVLVSNTAAAAPLHCQHETSGSKTNDVLMPSPASQYHHRNTPPVVNEKIARPKNLMGKHYRRQQLCN